MYWIQTRDNKKPIWFLSREINKKNEIAIRTYSFDQFHEET